MGNLIDDLNDLFTQHLAEGGTVAEWAGGLPPGHIAQLEAGLYPMPDDGWVCFHCGERFTTVGAAEDHFGVTPESTVGCLLAISAGEERGLLMELRKIEARNRELAIFFNKELERVREEFEAEHTALAGPAGAVSLFQSMLDELGPSADGAVERDLKNAIHRLSKVLYGDGSCSES